MTQDEIIDMARQSGWTDDLLEVSFVAPMLERFANLVAAKALAKEKALQALHDENERLGLYKDAYAEPEQEPMTEYLSKAYRLANELRCHLATAPAPQRTWVGLTLDQIALLHANYPNPQGFALALQAKLKERNT